MLNNATRRSIQCRRFLSSCGQQSGLVFLVDLAEMFRRVGFLMHVLFVLLIQRPDIVGKALLRGVVFADELRQLLLDVDLDGFLVHNCFHGLLLLYVMIFSAERRC